MEPTLFDGDFIIATRGPVRTGAIVIFEHPHRPGFLLVKRALAVGRSSVQIEGGSVLVDGRSEDPFDLLHTEPSGRWNVSEKQCFVLSDARTATVDDSRSFGPVPLEGIRVARFRYWPLRSFGRLAQPVS